jgi:cleavage stimulation factor subunit 2
MRFPDYKPHASNHGPGSYIPFLSSTITTTRVQTIGNVVHVRVMTDRGDPKKGYAFVEYDNADSALSAIQNLANVEVDGRKLRVGFSNNSGLEAIAKQRGLTITPGGGVSKSLEAVMAQFSVHEMYDMVAHMKEVAEARPEELRTLLISHPQIAEAIVHMQVQIGMIRPLARPGQQPPLPPPQPIYGGAQQPPLPPPQGYYQLPPPQQAGSGWGAGPAGLPPPQPYAPPPPPPPQQGGLGGAGALDAAALAANPAASQEMIKQILELTPEQLAAVDPARRQMLMDLKHALLQSGGAALLQPGAGAPR